MNEVQSESSSRRLASGIIAGVVLGILNVALAVAFGALIFSGDLAPFVSVGIGLSLFGGAAVGMVVVFASSHPGMIATPQDIPATILALVGAGIFATLSTTMSPEAALPTVVAAIALTGILTGVCFLVLGQFKLGNLVRFIPYPGIGGFLAGIGWLLLTGGLGVMVGGEGEGGLLSALTEGSSLVYWLPGVGFGIALLVVDRLTSHFLAIPLTIFAGIGGFYLVNFLSGSSLVDAGAQGLLLGPFPDAGLWAPMTPSKLAAADWGAVLGQAGSIGAIVVMSIISTLLNATGLELALRKDVDLNQELKAAGLANLAGALGAGVPGYHALADTTLAHRLGARGKLAGIIAAAMCAAALIFGAGVMGYFPKMVAGGMLVFLGLLFLTEWVVEAATRLPRSDYLIVIAILVAIASIGFLQGVGVGVALAVAVFIMEYSRIDVVKHALSGAEYQSNVERNRRHKKALAAEGHRTQILVLQGYMFFGTANYLLERVREILASGEGQVSFVILDFRLVSGIDTSAFSCFERMRQMAHTQGFHLLFAHLSPRATAALEKTFGDETEEGEVKLVPDLDHGLEWCEERIIAMADYLEGYDPTTRTDLQLSFPVDLLRRMMDFFERKELAPGDVLLEQGAAAEEMFFIEAGQVTVLLDRGSKDEVRLQTLRPGTIVGEVGMYLKTPRSASAVADQATTVYRLSKSALKRMLAEDPEAAAGLHKYVARMLSERLTLMNRTLRQLL